MIDIVSWIIAVCILYKIISKLIDRLDSIDDNIKDIKSQLFTVDIEEDKE